MADRYIPEHRRTQFKAKNQFKPDELRRRREEQQVEIRKQKREENLAKRRGILSRDGNVTAGHVGATDSDEEEGGPIESEVCLLGCTAMHALYSSIISHPTPQYLCLHTSHGRWRCIIDFAHVG